MILFIKFGLFKLMEKGGFISFYLSLLLIPVLFCIEIFVITVVIKKYNLKKVETKIFISGIFVSIIVDIIMISFLYSICMSTPRFKPKINMEPLEKIKSNNKFDTFDDVLKRTNLEIKVTDFGTICSDHNKNSAIEIFSIAHRKSEYAKENYLEDKKGSTRIEGFYPFQGKHYIEKDSDDMSYFITYTEQQRSSNDTYDTLEDEYRTSVFFVYKNLRLIFTLNGNTEDTKLLQYYIDEISKQYLKIKNKSSINSSTNKK